MVKNVGTIAVAGAEVPIYGIAFDDAGKLTSTETADFLVNEAATGAFTDVVVISHGWNNSFSDALRLYTGFFEELEKVRAAEGWTWKPLVIGVSWPSIAFLFPGEKPPQMAAGAAPVDDGDAALRAMVRAKLAGTAVESSVDEVSVDAAKAREIAAALFGSGAITIDDDDAGAQSRELEDVLAVAAAVGRAGAPAFGNVGLVGSGGASTLAAAGGLSMLDPRNLFRMFTVLQMKDRAGLIGKNGVGPFLARLLSKSALPVHVIGHSYGCRVMLAAIATGPAPARPVRSALLLQPALSARCFAADATGAGVAGGFRPALGRVELPILATYSENDFPLRRVFHLLARRRIHLGELQFGGGAAAPTYAALGGYGAVATAEAADTAAAAVTLGGSEILAVNCTNGIAGHGDVANAVTAGFFSKLRSGQVQT